jgi:Lon protease-like protein
MATFSKRKSNTERQAPAHIPIFPLPGALILPRGQLPLNIFEPRYLRMIDDALGGERLIGMIQTKSDYPEGRPSLYEVGCAGRITGFTETDDGRYLVTLTGVSRFRLIDEIETDTPYRLATIDWTEFENDRSIDPTSELIDRVRLLESMRHYLDTEGLKTDWDAVENAPAIALVDSLAAGCPFAPNEKQALLEAENARARAECLITLMEMARADPANNDNLQ